MDVIKGADGRKVIEEVDIIRCDGSHCEEGTEQLISEEPLLIRVEGEPYSVIMRTPGAESFHAAGFCLAEGLVDRPGDIATISHCRDMDDNVVEVRLHPLRRKIVEPLLERRGFVSQTSCGICGKELIEDMCQTLESVQDDTTISVDQALTCFTKIDELQKYYTVTSGSHAAVLFDDAMNVLSVGEDVGRHNALDKAIGKLFLARELKQARIAALSSRISYELVQKAARARIPIIISMSRPTALAVDLGRNLNMTLACRAKKSGLMIFSGEERLDRSGYDWNENSTGTD